MTTMAEVNTLWELTHKKQSHELGSEKTLERMKANPDDFHHGTLYGYNIGCRCSKCVNAYFESRRDDD